MITVADAPLLEAFCEAWATFKQASERLNTAPATSSAIGSPTGGRPSPYLKIWTEAARTMASLATRLGLSPADRNGLKLGTPKDSGRWGGLIG